MISNGSLANHSYFIEGTRLSNVPTLLEVGTIFCVLPEDRFLLGCFEVSFGISDNHSYACVWLKGWYLDDSVDDSYTVIHCFSPVLEMEWFSFKGFSTIRSSETRFIWSTFCLLKLYFETNSRMRLLYTELSSITNLFSLFHYGLRKIGSPQLSTWDVERRHPVPQVRISWEANNDFSISLCTC